MYGVALLAALLAAGLSSPAARADGDGLFAGYYQLRPQLENNAFGVPIHIQSNGENGTVSGDIYGVLDHPFAVLRDALGTPANWCEIAPQHLNIKACTYQYIDSHCQLSFYTGRKFYEKADDVYRIDYAFSLKSWQDDYFKIVLSAADGPLDTDNYLIAAEAIPLSRDTTFIHFHYSYDHGFVTDLAMTGYFATLGAGKIGFSVLDSDSDIPRYVSGTRGVFERNAMRYYFAIQTYLHSLSLPPTQRFEARLNQWYDLTEKYPAQLHEMEKTDYLHDKHLEHADQLRLQALADAAATDGHGGRQPNTECLRHGTANTSPPRSTPGGAIAAPPRSE